MSPVIKKKFHFFILLVVAAFSAPSYATALNTFGWRGVPVHSKYVREGAGWRLIGEISKLIDTDTGEFVGFYFHRDFRSYLILQNHGQPMIESWDFPLTCPAPGCPDSKLARVTFVPYKNSEMLGALTGAVDKEANVFRIHAGTAEIISIDSETMEIVGGVLREDLTRMPEMLVDPAIFCRPEITCIRSLAFGGLGHEDLRPQAISHVFARSTRAIAVPNTLVYTKRESAFANPIRFSLEADLIDASRRFDDRP